MDNTNTAQQRQPGATPEKTEGQPGIVPTQPLRFPEAPGVCIAGSTRQGVYRIVQSQNMQRWMTHLQSRTPFPLEFAAWLPGSYADSKRQRCELLRLFPGKQTGNGWLRLSASDLARASAHLAKDRERLASEADRARQQALLAQQQAVLAQQRIVKAQENAVDDCIRRLRKLAEHVRWCAEQECQLAKATWPHQQSTDECLQLVDRFHGATGKFEAALSRKAVEIQLARMPKDDAALSM